MDLHRRDQLHVRETGFEQVRSVQQQVLRPNGPLPADTAVPSGSIHLGAFLSSGCVGAVTLSPTGWPGQVPIPGRLSSELRSCWQLRSMAVAGGFRGGGIGRQLLLAAQDLAWSRNVGLLWAAARTSALEFYTKAGWCVIGPEWDKAGVGPHRYIWISAPTQ